MVVVFVDVGVLVVVDFVDEGYVVVWFEYGWIVEVGVVGDEVVVVGIGGGGVWVVIVVEWV